MLSAPAQGDVGFVKVILRREAWAKSHRPVRPCFGTIITPVVGGGDLGVMIVEGQPRSLRQVAAEIAKAETHTQMRFNGKRRKEEPNPSARKSEAGAIDRIELYGPSDRRGFSLEEALDSNRRAHHVTSLTPFAGFPQMSGVLRQRVRRSRLGS